MATKSGRWWIKISLEQGSCWYFSRNAGPSRFALTVRLYFAMQVIAWCKNEPGEVIQRNNFPFIQDHLQKSQDIQERRTISLIRGQWYWIHSETCLVHGISVCLSCWMLKPWAMARVDLGVGKAESPCLTDLSCDFTWENWSSCGASRRSMHYFLFCRFTQNQGVIFLFQTKEIFSWKAWF